MRIFKNKWFTKFAKKEHISDEKLVEAIRNAEAGKIDADLGGGVIKQRIDREGEGKSGGYRTIILYRKGERAFFVYSFAKSERANIAKDELRAFKLLAKNLFKYDDRELEILSLRRDIEEVFT